MSLRSGLNRKIQRTGGSENLTSKRRGSLPDDFQNHYLYYSDLGDGGAYYASDLKGAAFSAPPGDGQKSADDDDQ